MEQLELQPHPANHIYHDQGKPSSSRRPPEIMASSFLSLSSSSLPSSTTSRQPSRPKTTINASHYSLLLNDNLTGLRSAVNYQGIRFSDLVSEPDHNTILHLAASLGQSSIINLLKRESQFPLNVRNSKGELPVHLAARACELEAVKKLVSDASDLWMLEDAENQDKNTALHIALQNHQKEMAKYLFDNCKKTFYYLNNQGFSPLYLAIKAQCWDLVKDMLSENRIRDYPHSVVQFREGKSVIHAAIIAKKTDILESILEDNYELVAHKTDEMGRTPLSYAAYTGFQEGVESIIKSFPNQAFKKDEKGFFPIHWACMGGNVKVVKAFFSRQLGLPKRIGFLLNNKGQNILHVAAGFGKAEVVKYILQQQEFGKLINKKDEDGNTPFHLASIGKHPKVVYDLTWDDRVILNLQNKDNCTALDIAEEYCADVPSIEERLTWLSLRYAGVPRAPVIQYSNININDPHPLQSLGRNNSINQTGIFLVDQQGNQVTPTIHPKMKRKIKYKERINTLLVVSILVTTVTYASGFTVPGGYKNNPPQEGMATLAHKCAFQVFIVTNTIAMYTSILAAMTLIWAHLDDLRLVLLSLDFALPLLGTALAMMSVAFMAGLYVVLHGVIFWLSIMVLATEGAFLGAFLVLFIPLYSPTSCIRNNTTLRYVFHVPFTLLLLACKKDKHGTRT